MRRVSMLTLSQTRGSEPRADIDAIEIKPTVLYVGTPVALITSLNPDGTTNIHAHRNIVVPGTNHVDTATWNPLLYVFRHYFGVGPDLGRTFKAER
jgi:flavin reductase (DIM6/NTAB) family NADH-FMN oxidoreductase RutF